MPRFLTLCCLLGMLCIDTTAVASSLTSAQQLSFGTLIPLTTSGNITASLNGTLTLNGAATIAPSGTTATNGIMTYQATDLISSILNVQFSPQASTTTLTNTTSGGGTITVSNFTFTPSLVISFLSPTRNFNVGGTMTFSASSQPGIYTGSVLITVPALLNILGGIIVPQVSGSLPITVTLWRTLGATEQTQLEFGAIEIFGTTSTVRIAPQTGTRTISSGAGVRLIPGTPAPTAGTFKVTGQPNVPVTISTSSSTTLSSTNGNMNVTNFVRYPATPTLTLDGTGNTTFDVGADLTVNASQPAGNYTGTYTVTINY